MRNTFRAIFKEVRGGTYSNKYLKVEQAALIRRWEGSSLGWPMLLLEA
jgi:hypothetical protein